MSTPSAFQERVRDVVRRIRTGRVMTYGEVAAAAGSPRGARAVGTIMKANRSADVPCHRVIRGDMRAGDYNRTGGTHAKIKRLIAEGVQVSKGKIQREHPPAHARVRSVTPTYARAKR